MNSAAGDAITAGRDLRPANLEPRGHCPPAHLHRERRTALRAVLARRLILALPRWPWPDRGRYTSPATRTDHWSPATRPASSREARLPSHPEDVRARWPRPTG